MDKEPLLYSYFREKMDEHADVGIKTISHHKAKWVLSRYLIPTPLRPIIIEEMIDLGMLEKVGKFHLEIKWKDKGINLSEVVAKDLRKRQLESYYEYKKRNKSCES